MSDPEKIAQLNDLLRQTLLTGKVVLTQGVQALPTSTRERALLMVRCYEEFEAGNDLYGERDFGGFEIGSQGFFWKIDYYDTDLNYLSPDPAKPEVTTRVLTIMLADEY